MPLHPPRAPLLSSPLSVGLADTAVSGRDTGQEIFPRRPSESARCLASRSGPDGPYCLERRVTQGGRGRTPLTLGLHGPAAASLPWRPPAQASDQNPSIEAPAPRVPLGLPGAQQDWDQNPCDIGTFAPDPTCLVLPCCDPHQQAGALPDSTQPLGQASPPGCPL